MSARHAQVRLGLPSGDGGFVLPVALVVLLILAMITSVGLYASRNDFRAAEATHQAAVALAAADAGASRLVATWAQSVPALPVPGDSLIIDWQALPDSSLYRSVVYRAPVGAGATPSSTVTVRTTGRVRPPGTARRTVVTMVEAGGSGGLCCSAAVKVLSGFSVNGPKKNGPLPGFDGTDQVPLGWPGSSCPGSPQDLPGLITSDATRINVTGDVQIAGTPPIQQDTTITATDFTSPGGVPYDSLATFSNVVFTKNQQFKNDIGPVTAGGVCDTSVDTNWGSPQDPAGPCGGYAPIVHVAGNAVIRGTGQGQGILLVDGNLDIDDDFSYYGLVIVLGRLRIRGPGRIYGAVLVQDRSGKSELSGGGQVLYSSCAVQRAMDGLPPGLFSGASHTAERAWFEVIG